MNDWIYDHVPTWGLAPAVLLILLAALWAGGLVRRKRSTSDLSESTEGEGFIMSSTLGLLALLLAFTFALANARYDTRRILVVEEANAIGTTWLRAGLLDEPHRSRLRSLLEGYTANRIALAQAGPGERGTLLQQSGDYQRRLWAATEAGVRPIRHLVISQTVVETMNNTIDIGAARLAARRAHVPNRVLNVLLIYMAVAAFVLGYVRPGRQARWSSIILLVLLGSSFLLVLDIDRPIQGGIRESQAAMEDLLADMRAQRSLQTVPATP